MKAIILAAGRGSRMNEGTSNNPKCMMKLFGETLLSYCIRSLTAAGFERKDIGIVTGYRSDMIQVEGVHYFHNKDWEHTNILYSLTMAREWLIKEDTIVVYSDIVFSSSVIKQLMDMKNDISIPYYTGFWELWSKRFHNPLEDLETFRVSDGKLIEIGKRPKLRNDVEGQYMGILHFTKCGWNNMENELAKNTVKPLEKWDMTSVLQYMLDAQYEIGAFPSDELWLECDNQNDIWVYEKEYQLIHKENNTL